MIHISFIGLGLDTPPPISANLQLFPGEEAHIYYCHLFAYLHAVLFSGLVLQSSFL